VGVELLGRPFDDARLVGIGFAFERAAGLRRPPAITPALPTGGAPAATSVEVRASSGAAAVTARFEYDPRTGRLGFRTEVDGVAADDVHAVVLRREDDEGRRSVAAHLSGPGALSSTGSLRLSATARALLEAGELHLELVTRGQPVATARGRVVLPSR